MLSANGGLAFTGFPIMVNYLSGEGSGNLELGIGVIPLTVSIGGDSGLKRGTAVFGTATLGYRFQPLDGGFMFRIGLTPFFNSGGAVPSGGLSLGYAF
jgi:hypothetical protein